ncbi:hypothetical protein E8E14_002593 [Neopestalotiopsis sp. 37M]|nr:hypothetical protein E8E14_002593 [Neopestalotiopsis sp. 37M]
MVLTLFRSLGYTPWDMLKLLFMSSDDLDFNSRDYRSRSNPYEYDVLFTMKPRYPLMLQCLASIGEDNAEEDISTAMTTELTRALREREATEAADKAFALREVFGNLDIELSSSQTDYQWPIGKVYHTLFLDLLRHKTSFINLLIDSSGPETFSDVPSWVPDWSQTHKNDWNQSDFIYDYIELYGTEAAEPQMQISADRLGLWARQKDAIRESFPTMSITPNAPEKSDLGEGFVGLAMSFVRQVSCAFEDASTSTPYSTPGRTDLIHLDTYRALTGLEPTSGDDQHSDTKTLTRWIDLSKVGLLTSTALLSAFHDDDRLWPFMVRCYRYAHSRAIFVTAEGLYGTGPPGIAAADQIMWLKGVAVPMVLRSVKGCGSEFRVIGPAVVPGLMDLSMFNGADYGDKWEAVYLI